jgi:hypothetical protein
MLPSTVVSLVIFGLAGVLIWVRRQQIFTSVEKMMGMAVNFTAVALPYMVNYDYVILLIPLTFALIHYRNRIARLVILLIYILPWVGIIFGRAGNIIQPISGVALFVMFLFSDDILTRKSLPSRTTESISTP